MKKNNDDNYIKKRATNELLFTFLKNYILVLVIIGLIIVFRILNPAFISVSNLFTIMTQVSIVGLLAMGLSIIVIIGEFDISLGAISNFVSVIAIALVIDDVQNIYLIWTLSILIGIILSMINSVFVVYLGVPSFIVTLGMLSAATALSRAMTKGGITMFPKSFPAGFTVLGKGSIFNVVPISVVIFLVIAIILLILVEYTPFGRKLYAVGSNPDASNHVGIKVKSVKMKAFIITGFLYGVSGVLISSMFASASAEVGATYLMPAILSVIVGETFLSLGYANIKGTIISAFLLSILFNGFAMTNIPFYLRSIVQGMILLFTVGFQQIGKAKLEISYLGEAKNGN